MKLKLHRTVRTSFSEEVYIYDLDMQDEAGEPMDIGKMDLHYTDDQIVGTVLFWKDWSEGEGSDVQAVIDQVLEEISEPLGVSGEYDIEYYICDRDTRQFVSNIEDEFGFDDDDEEDYDAEEFEDMNADEEEDSSETVAADTTEATSDTKTNNSGQR